MKTQLCITARHLSLVQKINSLAKTVAVSIKDGLAIMTMTAETDLMKENSAMLNTKLVPHKSSLVRTLNVSEINTDAVRVLILFLILANKY